MSSFENPNFSESPDKNIEREVAAEEEKFNQNILALEQNIKNQNPQIAASRFEKLKNVIGFFTALGIVATSEVFIAPSVDPSSEGMVKFLAIIAAYKALKKISG